jgi:perosamine synthetase
MGMIKIPDKSIKFFSENYNEIFASGSLAEGKWNEQVATWACDYTTAPHALAVNSNGSGIFTILSLMKNYRSKKRLFLQSNTMYGVKTIAISSGLELIGYVDCTLEYLMPTCDQVADFINNLENPEECVFLLTHIGGWVNPDIEQIAELCQEKGVALIEDCAHSLGSLFNGKHTGLFGDAGVYSLYATKTIPVGEGGILVTKDKDLFKMAHKFIMYDRFDQKLDVGVNLRMSEINALLTFAVVREIDNILQNKYRIAQQYIEACNKYGWEYIDPEARKQKSNLYKFILLSSSINPEKEFAQIQKRTSPVYDYALGEDPHELRKRHICLPIWYMLEEGTVSAVVSELKK